MRGLRQKLMLRAVLAIVLCGTGWISLPTAAQTVQPPSLEGLRSTQHEDVALDARDAGVMAEYGLLQSGKWTYVRDGVTNHVSTLVFRDPSSAYGALTYWGTEIHAGTEADYLGNSPRGLLALKGNMLFILESGGDGPGGIRKPEFLSWVKKSASAVDTSPFPTLPNYLPERGRVADSERYVLGTAGFGEFATLAPGDWLGFNVGAEVSLAKYRANGREFTLVLAAYPTPQGAAGRVRGLATQFEVNPEKISGDGKKALFIRKASHILAIVIDAPTKEAADAVLAQFRYDTKLTWNEPSFKAKQENIGVMLYQVFLFTGVMCVYLILSSVLFAVIRVLVRTYLPEMIFDRPGNVELIRLGLTDRNPLERKELS
ncbi:MAG: hypothetical protein HY046_07525 [Acidobacteria bacterium]|nr:hypothetical protein [Acidobacteriota bacterium]